MNLSENRLKLIKGGGHDLREDDVLKFLKAEIYTLIKAAISIRPYELRKQDIAAERVMLRCQDCIAVSDCLRLVDKADSLIRRGKLDEVRKGRRFLCAAPA